MFSSSELIWVMVGIVHYMCDCKFENICIFDILVYKLC